MRVEHFMTEPAVSCDVRDAVAKAARLMRDRSVEMVVVVDDGKLAGVLTDGQIIREIVAAGRDPATTKVGRIMADHPATVGLEDNMFSVVDTFRRGGTVRSVPVVNAVNEVLGVVSIADVAIVAQDFVQAVLLEETHRAKRNAIPVAREDRNVRPLQQPGPTQRGRQPRGTRPRSQRRPLMQGRPAGSGTSGFHRGPAEASAWRTRRPTHRRTA